MAEESGSAERLASTDTDSRPFLGGWGGLVVAAIAIGFGILGAGIVATLWQLIDRLMVVGGASVAFRVMSVYWAGIAAWACWLATVLFGSSRYPGSLDNLRSGVGDWPTVVRLSVLGAPAGALAQMMWLHPRGLSNEYESYSEATHQWSAVVVVVVMGMIWGWRAWRSAHADDVPRAGASPS